MSILRFSLATCLILSIILNIFLFLETATRPTRKEGKLKRDVIIEQVIDGKNTVVKLPKGMIVEDDSPQGLAAIGPFNVDAIVISIYLDLGSVEW